MTQAAARLNVSEKTARRLVAAGKLPERRSALNGRLLFLADEIDALAAAELVTPENPT